MDAASFRSRVLAERTRALALRGREPTDDRTRLQCLVCIADGRHYALAPASVTAIAPCACHRVPLASDRAQRVLLGLAHHGGRLMSVLDLPCLLSPAAVAAPPGGLMLVLGLADLPPVALRVERVLGILALEPGNDGQAVLSSSRSGDAPGILATLVTEAALRDAIASLDGRILSPTDPSGA